MPRSTISDASSADLEEYLQDQELAKLQRQMHVLDDQTQCFQSQAKQTMTKQQQELQMLSTEGQEIVTSLNRALSEKYMTEDQKMTAQLISILDAEDLIEEAMKEEEKRMAELNMQISLMEAKVNEQKAEIGGLKVVEQKEVQTRRKIRTLSNRLDKAMVRFNQQLAKNAGLREQIDNLRHERRMFDKLYTKVLKQLESVRKEITSLVESATQAYEQRDEAHNKMTSLKERGEKEKAMFESEMKALHVVISHDNKLKEFMNTKANERLEYQQIEAAKRKKRAGADRPEEDTMTLISYEHLYERLKEATGTDDLTTMVENFIDHEDMNFALYNYVNELNNEIELMEDQIATIKKDIKMFIEEDTQTETDRSQILAKMEEQIREKSAVMSENTKKLKEVTATLDKLKGDIENLFKTVRCDPAPIRDMLGGSDEINNKVIMLYLGMIEHRVTELMNLKMFLDRPIRTNASPAPARAVVSATDTSDNGRQSVKDKHSKKRPSSAMKKSDPVEKMTTAQIIIPKPPERIVIEISPPDSKEEVGEDEDEQKPLTHAELRERVQRKLLKRDQMQKISMSKKRTSNSGPGPAPNVVGMA